jgi:hypothetical protein
MVFMVFFALIVEFGVFQYLRGLAYYVCWPVSVLLLMAFLFVRVCL